MEAVKEHWCHTFCRRNANRYFVVGIKRWTSRIITLGFIFLALAVLLFLSITYFSSEERTRRMMIAVFVFITLAGLVFIISVILLVYTKIKYKWRGDSAINTVSDTVSFDEDGFSIFAATGQVDPSAVSPTAALWFTKLSENCPPPSYYQATSRTIVRDVNATLKPMLPDK